VARPNPEARIDYPRDAYADGPARAARSRVAGPRAASAGDPAEGDDDDAPRRAGPWLWISALLALGVLALAAFLVVRLLGGGPDGSPGPQVEVPSFIGMTFEEARTAATPLGLEVEQAAFVQASAETGTVTAQIPAAGELVDLGTIVDLTIAIGPETTIVPDLRLKTESEALNLIFAAGLTVGDRTEAFDPIVPEGSVISQVPIAGSDVARLTPVSFVVSTGPEPTPTPSPTPIPTPPPPPPPTPTPAPVSVADYRCDVVGIARVRIENDRLVVGSITDPSDDNAMVVWQDPEPGTVVPPGTAVNLITVKQPAPTCPDPNPPTPAP
jgi:beta-lactam-binding protein with PASTA domain